MAEGNEAKLRVAIVIATLNRPDFVIRQLNYYAKLNSPHPVYIGDASNDEDSKKLQDVIKKIDQQLTVYYYRYPKSEYSLLDTVIDLYDKVQEKYCVFCGDDDYQIPNSIFKCADFLEHNPDYSSASGYAVSFRLINNGVYGHLNRLADYPRRQIESSTAGKRLLDFMSRYYVPLFSVHRTEQIKKCWLQTKTLENLSFSTEIFPSAMSLIIGKSKIVDCLSFIRQIHDRNLALPDTFDWILGKDWHPSFANLINILTQEIVVVDNIGKEEAGQIVKQASWKYVVRRLSREYMSKYEELTAPKTNPNLAVSFLKSIKLKIGQKLPWLKNIYRQRIRPLTKAPLQIHDEVLRDGSKFYGDFKPIMNSFTGL